MNIAEKIKEINERDLRVLDIKEKIIELYKIRTPQSTIPDWEDYRFVKWSEDNGLFFEPMINNLAGIIEHHGKQIEDLVIVKNDEGYMIVAKVGPNEYGL